MSKAKKIIHVSHASTPTPAQQRKIDLKYAGLFENVLQRHFEGRIFLDDNGIKRHAKLVYDLRIKYGEDPGPYADLRK